MLVTACETGRTSRVIVEAESSALRRLLLGGGLLRSLRAIHLAAARSLGDELVAMVTCDARMSIAAVSLGLDVQSPS